MRRMASMIPALALGAGLTIAQTPGAPGQTQTPASDGSFYAILVDARCSGSGMTGQMGAALSNTAPKEGAGTQTMMNRSTPGSTSGRTWNSTDANTSGTANRAASGTPPATQSGMNRRTPDATTGMDRRDNKVPASATARSTATAMDQSGTSRSNPHHATGTSGSADREATSSGNSMGDVATADKAGSWDRSCFISPSSTSFTLHTQDGRMIQLDSPSNSRIVSQLQNTQRVQNTHKIFRVKVKGSMNAGQFSIADIEM